MYVAVYIGGFNMLDIVLPMQAITTLGTQYVYCCKVGVLVWLCAVAGGIQWRL